MNKVIFQLWEESERGYGVRPDGCSLHIDVDECVRYIKSIYDQRTKEVPYEYERVVGESISVFIDDELFKSLVSEKSVRLSQNSMNNLISMNELIINNI